MSNITTSDWYVIGYLRTVPDERTFVFPVVQNEDVAEARAYYALNGTKLEFVEPGSEEALVRITPVAIGKSKLEDSLPLYGYEFDSGKVWFGDAWQMSKALIDFACGSDSLTARSRREISDFIGRVISRDEFIAKNPLLVQGRATLSESRWETDFGPTGLVVAGVGTAGGVVVEHMISAGVQGVKFICIDTDITALNHSGADQILLLDRAVVRGGTTARDKDAVEEAEVRIRAALDGANLLFITAGLGGGTGTGAAPVIARVAKEMGILTVGVVTKPFEFEGNRRMKAADAGLAELEANVDSLIVILNDKLLDVLGDDITQDQAFAHANDVLKNAIGGISDIIHMPGLVNVDFEDVKTVMSEPGKAMMGTAQASGPDRATKAAEAAVAGPLLEGIDLSGARGVLVLIAANRNTFKLAESRNAMNTIRRYAADDAHVIYGTAYDESLGDQLRVTVIATGLSLAKRAQTPISVVHGMPAQRTGTHDLPILQNVLDNAPRDIAPAHDYSALTTPSVWRNARSAAAKVDALASNGLDEIEIPAFLRRQAD